MPSITQRELERLQRVERSAAQDREAAAQEQVRLTAHLRIRDADLERVRRVALGLPVTEPGRTVGGEWGSLAAVPGFVSNDFGLTVEARLQQRLDRAQDQAQELDRRLAAVLAAVDMARAR